MRVNRIEYKAGQFTKMVLGVQEVMNLVNLV
jgi:hypothetical protein